MMEKSPPSRTAYRNVHVECCRYALDGRLPNIEALDASELFAYRLGMADVYVDAAKHDLMLPLIAKYYVDVILTVAPPCYIELLPELAKDY
jgi:hypothetical protein